MWKRRRIEIRFMMVVGLMSVALVGIVVGAVVRTAGEADKVLVASMVKAMNREKTKEISLVDEALQQKGDSLAKLLARTGASLIIGYDFESLMNISKVAVKDPDVAYVAYYDVRGVCLTGKKPTTKVDSVIKEPVRFEGENVGIVEVGLRKDRTKTLADEISGRVSRLVDSMEKELRHSRHRIFILSAAVTALGVVFLCLVVYGVMVKMVSRPVKRYALEMEEGAGAVLSASNQLSSASQVLAEGSSQQAAGVEETSSSLEEMNAMTRRNAEGASQALEIVRVTRQKFDDASGAMEDLQKSMNEIAQASQETQKIIKTIDEIAFQTNLLSLNAAVEAARAGEAGAGFAVVADEVRNLAMRAAEAAKNTSDIIENIAGKVTGGVNLVERTSGSFQQLNEDTRRLADLIHEIAEASREQAQGIEQVSRAVGDMDEVVQRNAANAEETASAAESLREQSERMKDVANRLIGLIEGSREIGLDESLEEGSLVDEDSALKRFSGKGNGKVLHQGENAPQALDSPGHSRAIPEKIEADEF